MSKYTACWFMWCMNCDLQFLAEKQEPPRTCPSCGTVGRVKLNELDPYWLVQEMPVPRPYPELLRDS